MAGRHTGIMVASHSPRLSGAELAWAAQSLLGIGARVRLQNWCVGKLTCRDIKLTVNGPRRAGTTSPLYRLVLERRSRSHVRTGHDTGCDLLGIPMVTIRGLLSRWGEADSTEFVLGVIDEVLTELRDARTIENRDVGFSVQETIVAVFQQRITPRAPDKLDPAA